LVNGTVPPGPHETEWNLSDDAGRPIAPGLYFTTLEWEGRRLTRKFATMR
jgi:hypothetical protein